MGVLKSPIAATEKADGQTSCESDDPHGRGSKNTKTEAGTRGRGKQERKAREREDTTATRSHPVVHRRSANQSGSHDQDSCAKRRVVQFLEKEKLITHPEVDDYLPRALCTSGVSGPVCGGVDFSRTGMMQLSLLHQRVYANNACALLHFAIFYRPRNCPPPPSLSLSLFLSFSLLRVEGSEKGKEGRKRKIQRERE